MSAKRNGGEQGVAPYTVDTKVVKLLEPRLMKVSTTAVDKVPCNRRRGHYSSFLETWQPYESAVTDECDRGAC